MKNNFFANGFVPTASASAEVVGILTPSFVLPHPFVNTVLEHMNDIPHSDADRVAAALNDVEEFAAIVEEYEVPLRRFILRISSFNNAEAEEVLQETFLNVWTNLHAYKSDLPFKSWIYRIARNTTISAFRKHKSRGIDQNVSLDETLYDVLPSDEITLGDKLDKKERAKRVRTVLAKMPRTYRDVLVLRFFEDQDYEAISDIIKKPTGTVATLIHRAKKDFGKRWLRLYPSV